MRPISIGVRLAGRDANDRAVAEFEALWREGRPSLELYWAGQGAGASLSVLGALIKVDLQNRFEGGERPTASEYLDRFPELAESGERAVSIIYEEFCLLEEHGEAPDSEQFCRDYEPWGDSLHSQLVYHRELSRVVGVESPPPKYPRAGERFARYHLRSILGTGGSARVYLATEDELGGRKVALKVSASVGREPSILANLDHRNIVPILTVTEPEDGLRGFCMPYRPGVTLEELMRRLGRGAPPRNARALWAALESPHARGDEGHDDDLPGWSDFPMGGSYSEAIAWVGLSLANALAYLHGRGVLHRDIKPANVLLAYREGPQLLDFNLAHAPNAPEHAQAALKGGTLPFMAPEQLRAFLDPAGWDEVGARADLYALGLVLHGLLTGQPPATPDARLPLTRAIQALHDRRSEPADPVRRLNPSVPPALESIIARCLEFHPSGRYEKASDLAEDLRRFLSRRPLKFAVNTSLVERAVNCVYRNRLVVAGAVLLTVACSLSLRSGRSAPSIRELPEFQQAVVDLDSGRPEGWERARAAFERLGRLHPRSGWIGLYRGVALERLGKRAESARILIEANEAIGDAAQRPDFDDALAHRLVEDPRSVTLLCIQARRITDDKGDGRRFARARPILQEALRCEPNRPSTLAFLAGVERNEDLLPESIEHFNRAIQLCEADSTRFGRLLLDCRKAILPALMRQADRRIDPGLSAEERQAASADLDRLEVALRALDRDWADRPADDGPVRWDDFRNFYGGAIASGRAVLEGDAGQLDQARRDFDEARSRFEAIAQDPRDSPDLESIRKEARNKLDELEQRRLLYFPKPQAAAPPASSAPDP